jgi:glutathione S-transferase
MQLITLPLSPFGRKAHIVAIEKGLDIEIVAPPSAGDPLVVEKNPLAKIPVLALATGDSIYDSPVICEYFDSIGNGALLIPVGSERWPVLCRAALADGIMDAAVSSRGESIRPDGERSQAYMDKQRQLILRAVRAAEADLGNFSGRFCLDSVALAVALTYLDIRHPGIGWRGEAPGLDGWHKEMEARPSFRTTKPSM